jgi:hypothetical protein
MHACIHYCEGLKPSAKNIAIALDTSACLSFVAAPRGGGVRAEWVSCVTGVARQGECLLLLEGVSGSLLDRQVRGCYLDGGPCVATTHYCTTIRTPNLVRSGVYIWVYVVRA